jgi:hypothetical protein
MAEGLRPAKDSVHLFCGLTPKGWTVLIGLSQYLLPAAQSHARRAGDLTDLYSTGLKPPSVNLIRSWL